MEEAPTALVRIVFEIMFDSRASPQASSAAGGDLAVSFRPFTCPELESPSFDAPIAGFFPCATVFFSRTLRRIFRDARQPQVQALFRFFLSESRSLADPPVTFSSFCEPGHYGAKVVHSKKLTGPSLPPSPTQVPPKLPFLHLCEMSPLVEAFEDPPFYCPRCIFLP